MTIKSLQETTKLTQRLLSDFNGNAYNTLVFYDRYAMKKPKNYVPQPKDIGIAYYEVNKKKNTALVYILNKVQKNNVENIDVAESFYNSGLFSVTQANGKVSDQVVSYQYNVRVLLGSFDPNSPYYNDKEIVVDRVTVCDETSFEEYAERIAREGSMGDKKLEKLAKQLIIEKLLAPAGRIASGLGNTDQASLFNCTVNERPKDNRDHIMHVIHTSFNMLAKGNGVGIDWSALRPEKSNVVGVQGTAGGPVGFMKIMNASGKEIRQGGGRGAAMMFTLSDWHPDAMKFIECKVQFDENGNRLPDTIDKANISLCVSEEFMDAVSNDKYWYFVFPDTRHEKYDFEWDGDIHAWIAKGYPVIVHGKIKAREMWKRLIQVAHDSGEPGVIFMGRYNRMSNSAYYAPIISTNPCGEQGLPAFGFCNLAHTNVGRLITPEEHALPKQVQQLIEQRGIEDERVLQALRHVNWKRLSDSVRTGVRIQDHCIDINQYDYPQQEKQQKGERRIGHGTLGLDDALKSPEVDFIYGEDLSLDFIFVVYGYYAYCAYHESIMLAKEYGAFPFLNKAKHKERPFIQRMFVHFPELEQLFDKYGIRNVTLLTQAPTGTVGTMLQASTGVEPHFALESIRVTNIGIGHTKMEKRSDRSFVSASCMDLTIGAEARLMYRLDDNGMPYVVKDKRGKFVWTRGAIIGTTVKDDMEYLTVEVADKGIIKQWDLPKSVVRGRMIITPTMHSLVQNTIQYWVDSSISKTVNMPAGATADEVMEVYETAYKLGEVKGTTVYVDMSRTDQVLYVQYNMPEAYQLQNVSVVHEDATVLYAESDDAVEACVISIDPETGQLSKSCAN